ncbi:hypothetical protein [Pseudonocardia sp. GCM10023141]|uniref:hypothetical protein n=1 Tax=Pseudonocardia sp. GCM10023141 TaxID=3252653 RepID=UPI00361D96CF
MAALIPFTSNYRDDSTHEGYQFEFCCMHCGNGYRSAFRHSATGFGGRLAVLGGSLLGGEIGNRIQDAGWWAQNGRSSMRGTTNDARLVEAAQDVAEEFHQCRRCTQWVCRQVCWDTALDCCNTCAPEVRESGRQGAAAGQAQCTACGATGSGRFCGDCGTPMVRPAFCRCCGGDVAGVRFCPQCGTSTG